MNESILNWDNILLYGSRILAFLTAIPFHEAAHAFVSDKLGDHTAREQGRLTLNPIKHIDPIGLLMMLVVGIGWAKPVPIQTHHYKNRKAGMAISAAAGPVSNFILAYVNTVLYKLVLYIHMLSTGNHLAFGVYAVVYVLQSLAIINVVLGVFNLIPIPPFDGSRIFLFFLPERIYFSIMKYERIIMIVMLALLWGGLLSGVLGRAYAAVDNALDWATGYIPINDVRFTYTLP